MLSSFKNNIVLALFAFVFSLGILSISHWSFAVLFSLSIFVSYQWLFERKNHWIYFFFAGLIGLFYAILLSPFSWSFVLYLCLGLLVLSYEKGIQWRKIPFLKPIVISICWFTLGIGIPKFALFGHIPSSDFLHLILFFVLAITEDFADMSVDKGHIKTIPLYASKSTTEALIVILLFAYFLTSPIIHLFSSQLEIKICSYLIAFSPLIYFCYLKTSSKINHRYFDFILFLIGLLHLLVQNKVNS